MSEYSHLSWSQTGPAIFTFVIAVQTFSLLFLYRDWSNRTCNIVLIVSWALLLFELCLENFVLTSPEKGPYYGISTGGIWCWISPKYRIARYTTDYLFMTASAAFSFILYSLVFFRLRGNISVSAGYRISFHPRPATRIGRTSDGTFVVTDDRRVESYLTTVAKHMLWYPIVYTFLIFPVAASRLSTFHGKPVPFFATMLTAAIFMLHGFFNTVLFCTTRSILPGSWRQKFGLQATLESGRGNAGQSGATNPTSQCTGTSTRSTGTSGTGPFPVVLNIHAEDVEIKYEAGQGVSEVKSGPTLPISLISSTSSTSSISPASLLQICGGSGQPANAHEHHIPPFSSPAPPDSRGSTCSKAGEDDKSSDLSVGIPLESMGKEVELEVPEYLGRASSDHESGVYGPARA